MMNLFPRQTELIRGSCDKESLGLIFDQEYSVEDSISSNSRVV